MKLHNALLKEARAELEKIAELDHNGDELFLIICFIKDYKDLLNGDETHIKNMNFNGTIKYSIGPTLNEK